MCIIDLGEEAMLSFKSLAIDIFPLEFGKEHSMLKKAHIKPSKNLGKVLFPSRLQRAKKIFESVIIRHQKCPYQIILEACCPLPDQSLLKVTYSHIVGSYPSARDTYSPKPSEVVCAVDCQKDYPSAASRIFNQF